MPRILATILSALTIIGLGIYALQYRAESLAGSSLTGADAQAFNTTRAVSTDVMTIVANALPRLFIIVILALVVVMLLIIRN